MTSATLVVELLTEELPPKALKRLSEAFAQSISATLKRDGYFTTDSHATAFSTPRRLAVSVTHVLARSPDQPVRQRFLPVNVALDAAGEPTPVLRKKLESAGIADWRVLKRESDGKGEVFVHEGIRDGLPLAPGLQTALNDAIEKLPIAKVMSYAGPGSYYNDEKFVRPAHKLIALHGAEVVPVEALGLTAGRTTSGHRFLSRQDLEIGTADAYEEMLRAEGKVIASFAARRAAIEKGLAAQAGGATLIAPDALLDEVTALVEWPIVYAGSFDPAFLAVPQECLILTMQQNQRYFALADAQDKLVHRFLMVSNIETRDPSAIVHGNERVLRARLADAKFFFDQDRKTRLEARVDRLRSIVFHNKLGTQADRMDRVRFLAKVIATKSGANTALADRAAMLAKADLVTDMVGEFPELQGVMGRYYAQHDGEPAEVADAIEQHYWPRFSGDRLPESPVAKSLALADKLETLAGMFGIGQIPTGDKDPFGLRRAALGIIRILIEGQLPLSLPELVALAFDAFDSVPAVKDASPALMSFIYDRLRGFLREQGYTANQTAAVLDGQPAEIHLVPARLAAVQAFEALPESGALAAANKRIVNILRKSESEAASAVDRSRLQSGAEHDLWLAFQKLGPAVEADCGRGDFAAALKALASAKGAVDRFFDDVMVMADDPVIRANRLALLRGIAGTMNRVADISKLAA